MTTATIDKTPAYRNGIRPSFSLKERTIFHGDNSSLYIPLSQLPEEIVFGISFDTLEVTFSYSIAEEIIEKELDCNIEVKMGIHTNRIFSLRAKFETFNFAAMIRRFDDINNCLRQLKSETQLTMVKKSYDLIMSITEKFKASVKQDQIAIIDAFEKGRLQKEQR